MSLHVFIPLIAQVRFPCWCAQPVFNIWCWVHNAHTVYPVVLARKHRSARNKSAQCIAALERSRGIPNPVRLAQNFQAASQVSVSVQGKISTRVTV